jgi:hypothetical protein
LFCATNYNIVIIPHPSYSSNFAPYGFTFCEKESQAVLDSIKENYFHGAFNPWKQ